MKPVSIVLLKEPSNGLYLPNGYGAAELELGLGESIVQRICTCGVAAGPRELSSLYTRLIGLSRLKFVSLFRNGF